MEEATKKGVGKGFSAHLDAAIKGGQTGGRISRRPRTINLGSPLTSEEMLFIADGVSAIIGLENPSTKEEIENVKQRVDSTSHLLMSGEWHKVFSTTIDNPLASLSAWKMYLLRQWREAYRKITDGNLTNEDDEWLRSLRNVSEAFNVATKTKTKWVKEAKSLKS